MYDKNNTRLETWFERDRAMVALMDNTTDTTLIQWVDNDVREAITDGFLNPKDYHGSALDYFNNINRR